MIYINCNSHIPYKLHTIDDESRTQAVSMVASDSTVSPRMRLLEYQSGLALEWSKEETGEI
jgi:hypothetical protein